MYRMAAHLLSPMNRLRATRAIIALATCLVACNEKPPVPAPSRPAAVEASPSPPPATAAPSPPPATAAPCLPPPSAPPAEPPTPVDGRPGAWSAPVAGLRGRLVVVRLADSEGHRQAGLDLELENVRDVADAIRIAWEGASSMLDFTLEDAAGHAVPRLALGGNELVVPARLALPPGATLRLRILAWALREREAGAADVLPGVGDTAGHSEDPLSTGDVRATGLEGEDRAALDRAHRPAARADAVSRADKCPTGPIASAHEPRRQRCHCAVRLAHRPVSSGHSRHAAWHPACFDS